MIKLLILIPVVLIVVVILLIGKVLFKFVDHLEVEEKMNDLKHKANLTEDVEEYTSTNEETIDKASSNIVDEFKNS